MLLSEVVIPILITILNAGGQSDKTKRKSGARRFEYPGSEKVVG